jgi:RNA polymerase sigma factor (sigma-70 family)
MSDSSRDILRRFFVLGYDELRTRLTHRLGSAELANDVLHETWLNLDRASPAGPVQSPKGFLLRMAINVALKRWSAEKRFVTLLDAKAAIGLVDDAPSPERSAVARSEVEVLVRALGDLTPRRRDILLASRLENIPLHMIAARLEISQRLVEIELKHALAHCALRLGRDVIQRFGPRPSKGSISEAPES